MGANAFIENFLAGVSRGLFIFYIFLSPFFIEDELRRIDPRFNIAQIFLPLLALVKLFFGLMHHILKSNSKEVTKLLITMLFLSGIVLHSRLSSERTFKDIYFHSSDASQEDTHAYLFGFQIPNILDTKQLGVGMTANVAVLPINSINLIAYHWLIIIGMVSSLCCHMIVYSDYSRIGRMGFGLFYILYGISIMVLSEFQRPWIHFLTTYNMIDESTTESAFLRSILIIAFVCCSCGVSLLTSTKYKKLGIFIAIGYVTVLLMYEMECLLIGQTKRKEKDIGVAPDTHRSVESMLKYHDKYIYPTDYQLTRILNLAMVLSGTLFEMLKIYHPEAAVASQEDYSTVDEKVFDEDDAMELEQEEKKTTQMIKKKKKKNRGKNKKQNKSQTKKQK